MAPTMNMQVNPGAFAQARTSDSLFSNNLFDIFQTPADAHRSNPKWQFIKPRLRMNALSPVAAATRPANWGFHQLGRFQPLGLIKSCLDDSDGAKSRHQQPGVAIKYAPRVTITARGWVISPAWEETAPLTGTCA